MANSRISELLQRTPNGQEYFEVIIPPFTPGTNRKVLLSDLSAILEFNFTLASASVSAGTMNLNFDSKQIQYFNNTTTIAATVTVTFSNAANIVEWLVHIKVTGARVFQLPSTCRMYDTESIGGRWNTSNQQLTLTGVTDTPFTIQGLYDGTIHRVMATPGFV